MSDSLAECAGVSEADLAEVLALVTGTDIVELDLTFGSGRLSLRRPARVFTAPPTATAPQDALSLAIASPLVGIFRTAMKEGEAVTAGQAIGAIDSLGIPTSVDAPQGGTVEELLVPDGTPVEYGQPLVLLRRAARA